MNRARRGGLSALERQELVVHLGACADCRIAWRLAHDFDGSAGARPGDERLFARATAVALAGSRRKFLVARVAASAAAAIVLLVGVASAALLLDIGRERWTRDRAAAAPAAAGGMSRSRRHGSNAGPAPIAAPAPEPPAPELAPADVPAVAPAPDQPGAVASVPPAEPRTGPAAAEASGSAPPPRRAPTPTPAAASSARLFAQAVEARRQGHAERAIALFRELQRTYPLTPEAHVTLVSLGDLLLMSRSDPAAALSAFDEYLRLDPAGALFPEALNGRARALTALGRRHDAEEAWRELDARLPASPYTRAHGGLPEGARP